MARFRVCAAWTERSGEHSGDQRRAMGRHQLYGLRLQMLDHHPQLSIEKPLSKMCFRLSYRLRVPLLEEPGYFVHLFVREELRNIEFPARAEITEVPFDLANCHL